MLRTLLAIGGVLVASLFGGLGPEGLLRAARAQPTADGATITGTVRDTTTGRPLAGAHVFIATSTIGTTTGDDGRFTLADVPPGAKRLYVSMMGYRAQTRPLVLRADSTYRLTIDLEPTVVEMDTVTVQGERDDAWLRHLRTFERRFIGTSPFAERCSLANPEVLRFDAHWWGKLEAEAAEPLVIINRALGYRVRYFLEAFEAAGSTVRWDGEPLFEPLTPSDSAEAARWRTNRRRAYYGSMRHFFRALLAGRTDDAGFQMRLLRDRTASRSHYVSDGWPASRDRLLGAAETDSLHTLNFFGRLRVTYLREPETEAYLRWQGVDHKRGPRDTQTSYLELNEHPVHLDRQGDLVEPYGATSYGYFAYERIGALLPVHYRPDAPPPSE